jgi:hypothetical protein
MFRNQFEDHPGIRLTPDPDRRSADMKPIVLRLMISAGLGFIQMPAQAVTLDEVFARVNECRFDHFYYAPWDTTQAVHPYFAQRKLEPYREEESIYYFKVQDTLFGLPVVELFVPGTWDIHGVILDVPLAVAREALRKRFGTTFAPSTRSRIGEEPALLPWQPNPGRQSVLVCEERPYADK